ncbi:DUF2157 domain-containing protein [Cohaesibacter celericrescens]|nr:DUF2157 domain-containing protein [Cohaesibacter celericrescens]
MIDKLAGLSIDRHRLDELTKKGVIDAELRQQSLNWLHPAYLWANWTMLLLLAFGTGLMLSGIIFFFAFNWASIPDLVKLAVIQAALVLAAIGAWQQTPDRLTGRLLLLVAATLVGVFLATFGQIYQTGADAWQLFALWAVLMTPWTLVSRLAVMWVLWLGLINLALWLFWQADFGLGTQHVYFWNLIHVAFIGSALILRERLVLNANRSPHARASTWLAPHWTRWLLVAAMLLFLFPNMLEWITNIGSATAFVTVSGVLATIVCVVLLVTYRKITLDIPALTMVLLMLCLLVVIALAVFFDTQLFGALGTTFWTAVTAIICFAAAAGYLRRLLALEGGQKDNRDGETASGNV